MGVVSYGGECGEEHSPGVYARCFLVLSSNSTVSQHTNSKEKLGQYARCLLVLTETSVVIVIVGQSARCFPISFACLQGKYFDNHVWMTNCVGTFHFQYDGSSKFLHKALRMFNSFLFRVQQFTTWLQSIMALDGWWHEKIIILKPSLYIVHRLNI